MAARRSSSVMGREIVLPVFWLFSFAMLISPFACLLFAEIILLLSVILCGLGFLGITVPAKQIYYYPGYGVGSHLVGSTPSVGSQDVLVRVVRSGERPNHHSLGVHDRHGCNLSEVGISSFVVFVKAVGAIVGSGSSGNLELARSIGHAGDAFSEPPATLARVRLAGAQYGEQPVLSFVVHEESQLARAETGLGLLGIGNDRLKRQCCCEVAGCVHRLLRLDTQPVLALLL